LREESELSRVFVTGQQIGLLGGPLYTVYKVLGAAHFAEQTGGKAVYWLETNDADFNEINHIDYLDSAGKLRNLTWAIDSKGHSCGLIEVDDSLVELLEKFFSSLRQTEFTSTLKDMALRCYKPGRTLGEASRLLAAEMFGFLNIEIFTPDEEKFREFSRSILLREAERTADDAQCNLFCMIGKKREALFKKGGAFFLRNGTPVVLSRYDLVPNVKTRNVCQDAYLNTDTYIAGPGEIKYISELDPVYRYHGIKKTAVKPRMSITLIEPRVKRLLKKTGLSLNRLLEQDKAILIKNVLKEKSGFDFKETLRQANASTAEYMHKLGELGLETKEIGRLLRTEVKNICGKKRTLEKKKHGNLLESLEFLSDNIKPYGKKQERVFNAFYYMNLFGGKGFINWVFKNYDFAIDKLEV
jgi:uncharacterized protein YllA (UPF0747 family)